MGCNSRILLWVLIGLALLFLFFNPFAGGLGNPPQIDYSTFKHQLQQGNVKNVTIQGEQIRGTLKEPAQTQVSSSNTITYTNFSTYVPSVGDNQLLPELENQGVTIKTEPTSNFSWVTLLVTLAPLLILIGLGYILFRSMRAQGQGGIFSMGQSRAKLYNRAQERTTFDDVAGAHGAKAELEEIIDFLKHPGRFQRLGGEIPKGVLLVGPPGTGKTLLARAVAGEASVPFFSITGSDFMEMFVGVGASRVRSMFEDAKKAAPGIIFIDELDSIGRQRGAGVGGGHDEREQTLNQLLNELDGFEPNQNVIVMAATNRPDILDPALLRPGRFDRQITVDLPTLKARVEILKIHSRNKPLADEADLEETARGTPGFSGADLENMLNEAALLAARNNKNAIETEDIEEARDKVMMGLEREGLGLTDEECRLLAYHEGGHAVVAAVLPNADPVHKVSIVPRGRAMGVTQQLPERDKYLYQRDYMLDRLAVMMGGRAAEQLVLNTETSGAENDLKQATKLARKMVLDWGMSRRFEHIALGGERQQVFLGEQLAQGREYSETTAREVDEEVNGILEEAYQRATSTLQEHRAALDRLADVLVEEEEIPGKRVLEIIEGDHQEEPQGDRDGAQQ
jgi:cell division protease FtsH